MNRREWYERTNAAWPATVPALTADEAVKATKKLYRYITGRKHPWPIKLTSGRRKTWRIGGVMYVNHERGWHTLIHYLSHLFDPEGGAHTKAHARLERRMILEVVRRGWLTGALRATPKPEAPPVDPALVKRERLLARIKRWESKERRATTALRKLRRSLKRLAAVAA